MGSGSRDGETRSDRRYICTHARSARPNAGPAKEERPGAYLQAQCVATRGYASPPKAAVARPEPAHRRRSNGPRKKNRRRLAPPFTRERCTAGQRGRAGSEAQAREARRRRTAGAGAGSAARNRRRGPTDDDICPCDDRSLWVDHMKPRYPGAIAPPRPRPTIESYAAF